MIRKRFPKAVVVQGRNPYVFSQDSSAARIGPRGRRMIEAVDSPSALTPSDARRERRRACEVPLKARSTAKTVRMGRNEVERRLLRAIDGRREK